MSPAHVSDAVDQNSTTFIPVAMSPYIRNQDSQRLSTTL